jgi:hypothetical protein
MNVHCFEKPKYERGISLVVRFTEQKKQPAKLGEGYVFTAHVRIDVPPKV